MSATFHAADWHSPRLKPAAEFVKRCTVISFTPWELANATKCTNPTGIVSELRANGFKFDKKVEKVNGKPVTHYLTVGVPK